MVTNPSPGPLAYSNVPIPDPSAITALEIEKAKKELRSDYQDRIGSVEKVIDTRLLAIDRATILAAENFNRVPTLLDRETARLEKFFEEKFQSIVRQAEERFKSISLQFTERDVRATAMETAAKEAQAALSTASTTAVNAALQAQKESAFATQQFVAESARKSEVAFTNQITSLGEVIAATKESLSAAIGELRSRLDRGEGSDRGVRTERADAHMTTGSVLGIVGGAVGVLTLLAAVIFGIANMSHQPTPPALIPGQSGTQTTPIAPR